MGGTIRMITPAPNPDATNGKVQSYRPKVSNEKEGAFGRGRGAPCAARVVTAYICACALTETRALPAADQKKAAGYDLKSLQAVL
jgi:hypothetical protein